MQRTRDLIAKLGVMLIVLALAFGAGGVYAQTAGDIADSDSGQIPPGVSGSGGGESELQNSASQPVEDQSSPSALISPVLSYYFVPGTEFKGKSSNFGYTYTTKGCFFRSTTLGTEQYTAPIHIPNGSVMKGIRVYFVDTLTGGGVGVYLTSYNPGVSSKDLVFMNNGYTSIGSGFVDSEEFTQTVTTETAAYTLIVTTGAADSTVQVCGIRLAYYPPATGYAFLPVVMSK